MRSGEFTTLDATLIYHLWNLAQPRIYGTRAVGGSLSATPGFWTGPQPTFTYTWLRESTPIGTGEHYVVQPRDAGHRITVRVDATQFWHHHHYSASRTSHWALIPGDPQPEMTASKTTGSASYKHGHRKPRVVLRLSVTAAGTVPDGTVSITEAGHARATDVPLVAGRAVVILRNPGHRRHTYTVTYSGSVLSPRAAPKSASASPDDVGCWHGGPSRPLRLGR